MESASGIAGHLARLKRESQRSTVEILKQYQKLAFSPGRISFDDFVRLRLFDDAFRQHLPTHAYVGSYRNRQICAKKNADARFLGLAADKIASSAYLQAFGLPVPPTVAIFAPHCQPGRPNVLASNEELHAFLTSEAQFPLFAKPTRGYQSLGTSLIKGYEPSSRTVELDTGSKSLAEFVQDTMCGRDDEILFQPFLSPSAQFAAICGARLSCARVVTLFVDGACHRVGAVLKIPAGPHVADNYWRPGNLLAQVDGAGQILRVSSGAGFDYREVENHPDTGARLPGVQIDGWRAALDLVTEAASVMQSLPLIGWDIAFTDQGPVIIEMNEAPDFFLLQLAERQGVLLRPNHELMRVACV
jgi:hypothetical protein